MYLRTPRMLFFFLTTILSAVTFALASWGLATGEHNKDEARRTLPGAELHIQDALNVGGAVTAAAGVASLLCLAGLFFLFFRHNQPETIHTVRIKEGLFAFAAIFYLATLIAATVIMATRSGYITAPGIPSAIIASLVAASGKKLAYKDSTPIKAYVAVGWCAFVSTVINLILVSLEARHVLRTGHSDGTQGELVGQHNTQSLNDTEKGRLSSEHRELDHHDDLKSERMTNDGSHGTVEGVPTSGLGGTTTTTGTGINNTTNAERVA